MKYDLELVAGNFMLSEFQPCIEPVLDGLDEPEPQYVATSTNRANLPNDPYATSNNRRKHGGGSSFPVKPKPSANINEQYDEVEEA